MAIKPLHVARAQGVGVGRRVDDAVLRRRQRSARALAVAREVEAVEFSQEFNAYDLPVPKFEQAHQFSDRGVGQPEPGVARAELAAARLASAAPAIQSLPRTVADPAFEADIAMAQKLATPVRAVAAGLVDPANLGTQQRVEVSTAPARYRFTNKGLRLLVTLGFALSIAIGAAVGAAFADEPVGGETALVMVQPGDTLWSIASSLTAPGQDVRLVLGEIIELNELQNATIASGQNLLVPSK